MAERTAGSAVLAPALSSAESTASLSAARTPDSPGPRSEIDRRIPAVGRSLKVVSGTRGSKLVLESSNNMSKPAPRLTGSILLPRGNPAHTPERRPKAHHNPAMRWDFVSGRVHHPLQ